ncbi:MAG TPA: hypothetical protein VHH35_05760 [Pyrinomonadaceae bacterium]|nr:hypothetical protein [Pyrinomonadaceae bacterium]
MSVTKRISATSLLQVWERGQLQAPVEKALTLLAAAYPDATREELAMLSIGRRDASLLSLREQLFGSQLSSLTACPACGEQLELNFNVADIRAETPSLNKPLSVCESGYELELRLPTSLDLLRLVNCSTIDEMRSQLFAQCVTRITHEGEAGSIEQVPNEIVDHAIARMGEADPQADVEVDLNCPECRHVWQTGFDIVSYLWSEVHTWAGQMLREVHLLASGYGWSESDILNMSAPRRRGYLEMLAG